MHKLLFVTFQPDGGHFRGFISLEELIESDREIESLLNEASHKYERIIIKMRSILADIERIRSTRNPVPARIIWLLGDEIFKLTKELKGLTLQIDGIYEHLERDLNVKRKWVEKVIILRRYIPEETSIPETINWGYFEKSTRRKAEDLIRGIS